MFGKRGAFWIAVGGTAVLADVVVNLAADRLGDKVPGLQKLNAYRTRQNG